MGNVFRFKRFEINQDGCAMKINTDGVLLAAIAAHPGPVNILDIGTGTGVIAMMTAQRFPEATVDAVEIDRQSTHAATSNFESSPFAGRIKAFHTDIAGYETENRYDLVISNPPFFVNDLKNPEERKRRARHTDEDFFESLLSKTKKLLTAEGLLWLILPVKQADLTIEAALNKGLWLQKEISICSDLSKPVIRKIICLGRTAKPLIAERFYIYEAHNEYTDAYKTLLKDFFLAF